MGPRFIGEKYIPSRRERLLRIAKNAGESIMAIARNASEEYKEAVVQLRAIDMNEFPTELATTVAPDISE